MVTEDLDGELRLIPALYDRFLGSSLDPQWVSAVWIGGAYSPALSAGILTHTNPGEGAYVHSLDSFEPGTTLHSRLMFSRGGNATAPYLYFGFAGNGLNPWALFGTGYTGDQVYASVYVNRPGDPVTFPLGDLFEQWHDYEISWQTDRIEFWVDGILMFTEYDVLPGPLFTYFSAGNGTPAGASISSDWVRVENYGVKQITPVEILNDTFSEPDGPATNWELITNGLASTGTWSVVNNRFVHSPDGTSYHPAVLNSTLPTLSNFTLQVDAMSPDETGIWGLVWGLQDGSNFYFAQFYSGAGLKVYRVDNWAFTQLTSNTGAPAPVANQWFTLRLEAQDGVYHIYVDGVEQLTVTDTVFRQVKWVCSAMAVIPASMTIYCGKYASDLGYCRILEFIRPLSLTPKTSSNGMH